MIATDFFCFNLDFFRLSLPARSCAKKEMSLMMIWPVGKEREAFQEESAVILGTEARK